ncbi:MAG: hypothetical protein ACREPS_08675, partial [Rhodanobacteraceae bacterium]
TAQAAPVRRRGYTEPNATRQRGGEFSGRTSYNERPRNASAQAHRAHAQAHSAQRGKAHAKKDKKKNGQHR